MSSILRAITRSPGSYVTAVLTLATGIGAVVAIFSVYAAVVLNPMSVPRPQELVAIEAVNPKVNLVPTSPAAQLYAVNPRDPWIFAGVAAVFGAVALAASLAPSWRAARLDPIQALRRV